MPFLDIIFFDLIVELTALIVRGDNSIIELWDTVHPNTTWSVDPNI